MSEKRKHTADELWVAGRSEKWIQAYSILCSAILVRKPDVTFPYPMSFDTFQSLIDAAVCEIPFYTALNPICRFNYDEHGYVTDATFEYLDDLDQIEKINQQTSDIADEIVSRTEDFPDDWTKVAAFAHYLVTTSEVGPWPLPEGLFDLDSDISDDERRRAIRELIRAQSAAGPLIDHRSVCAGYAKAMAMLCGRADIECYVIAGNHGEYGGTKYSKYHHNWNMVVLDGKKYYLDLVLSKNNISRPGDGKMYMPLLILDEDLKSYGYRPWLRPFAKTGHSERAIANRWAAYKDQASMSSTGTPALKAS